ncbi:uncharacterized protein [Ptychodera flava]|uniref:uncharacterized protein n=1 Tax=Ptychodera flava TaxID=63121 RepID=UPI003969C4C6
MLSNGTTSNTRTRTTNKMANPSSEALLVSTSWNTASDDLTSQPTTILVKDFYENTLKSNEFSKLYCTVLDVEVSEGQKKDAESVGVTLIPATRSKWADPDEDPPVVNWLFNHYTYYNKLKDLQNVKHVVSFSPKTKNAAAAIHESLFPQAQLHQISVPDSPASTLLIHTSWVTDPESTTALTTQLIIKYIRENTLNSEIIARLYCTVFDTEISEDQKLNAESVGVTLMQAKKSIVVLLKIPLVKHGLFTMKFVIQPLENTKYQACDQLEFENKGCSNFRPSKSLP